jgi:hypothetical protein
MHDRTFLIMCCGSITRIQMSALTIGSLAGFTISFCPAPTRICCQMSSYGPRAISSKVPTTAKVIG